MSGITKQQIQEPGQEAPAGGSPATETAMVQPAAMNLPWAEAENDIYKQNNKDSDAVVRDSPQANTVGIVNRVQEQGYQRGEQEVGSFLDKGQNEIRQYGQMEQSKQPRSTANQAKKFIGDCASTLNSKQDWSRKKKSTIEQDPGKKRKVDEMKQQGPVVKSKRKVRPQQPSESLSHMNPEQRFINLENSYRDCQSLSIKRTKKMQGFMSQHPRCYTWAEHQFFYSSYDLPYYSNNFFSQMLHYTGLWSKNQTLEPNLKYSQYEEIRKAIGKPKLFSVDLIEQERAKLEYFRTLARNYAKNQNINQLLESLPNRRAVLCFKKMTPLKVGQNVVAMHPICGHLHIGSILALYKENLIMVKFNNPQLGVQKVLDINISADYRLQRTEGFNRQAFMPNNHDLFSQKNSEVVENFDFQAAALAIQLLQCKNDLVTELKANNNLLEEMKSRGEAVGEDFQQRYGWVNCLINIINFSLKHIIVKFRLRGSPNYSMLSLDVDMEDVGRNMPKLLTNPLSFMEKQLENNVESQDVEAMKKIREMMEQQQQGRINEAVAELCRKNNPEGKFLKHQQLVKNFLSIFMTLKLEGKISNISENKYLKAIASQLYPQHSKSLAEIGDQLINISKS